ncbi:glycosyltransferase family 25 protein [Rhodohalobacter sp. 614A]|uniref:glycosyltransferase family 25 protein n=1 Tax=Rhodohalobacter sp. 614A TaxID=2908649 RepID=UPI001F228049|nr:glycosyltransferase family 25 protein [Rhodohalobacter sp. 614A]
MEKKEKLFELLNNFFDKVYVISLKRSSDRHALIKERLDGLNYEIFWGFDGRELEYKDMHRQGLYHPNLSKLLKKRKGKPAKNMSRNQIGCALSHVGVYEEIIKNNYSKTLVLEDDPIINFGAADSLEKALQEMPDTWDFLYLGYHGANKNPTTLLKLQKNVLTITSKLVKPFERLRMIDEDVMDGWFAKPYSENLEKAGTYLGTYAYGITPEGAKKILKFQRPVVQEADNVVAELSTYGWIEAYNVKEDVFLPNREIYSTVNNG